MHTKNLLITLTTLLLLASTTLDAKTPKEPCSTKVECDAMVEKLQGKIDVLDAKIKEELTKGDNSDWDLLGVLQQNKSKLQDKKFDIMIAEAKARTAEAKAKNAELKKIIAQKDTEIAKENAKQVAIRKSQDKKLDEIRALLKINTK